MSNQLTFQNTQLTVISRNNQTYISASDLARALQYSNTRAVSKIYTRNQDEFTTDMTLVVNLTTKNYGNGNSEKEHRIFSLRGCHLIAMFSRTPVAKEFRKWVLDILDRETNQPQQLALPETYNLSTIQNSEETLMLIIQLYSYCSQAHEMQEKLQRTSIPNQMEKEIGGHYLYNFKYPLEHTMLKAKKYIQSNTERLSIIKAVNNLLS